MNKNVILSLFAKATTRQEKEWGLAPAIALTLSAGYLTYHILAGPSGNLADFLAGFSVAILWVCVLFLWDTTSFKKSKSE